MRRRELVLAGAAALPGLSWAQAGATIEDAFFYGYAVYEFARTAQAYHAVSGLNQLTHNRSLADHTFRSVTSPNTDTVYSMAFLDLSSGPVLFIAPSVRDRYYSVAFMNVFTDNFAYIGTRATNGEGGRFWIAGPGFRGAPPAGVSLIRSDVNDVWLLARIEVQGPEDLPQIAQIQDQMWLSGPAPARPFEIRATSASDPANFLAVVNETLGRAPANLGQAARAQRFSQFGVVPGDTAAWLKLPGEVRRAWAGAPGRVLTQLRARAGLAARQSGGWTFPPAGIGDFGENDRVRAAIALNGLAALSAEEAVYLSALTDHDGAPLSGQHRYRIVIPAAGVPARAFWSLTAYERAPDGRWFLIENPIQRFSIGDRTRGLIPRRDGALEILVQRDRPDGELAANWLPAAAGEMRLSLRAYLPQPELANGSWAPPPIERIS